MRLNCEVLVCSRQLGSPNCKARSCPTSSSCNGQASLSIGWEKGRSAEPSNTFIYLCTAKRKKYTKYKIIGNVEKLFTRLVSEGKFIIYFREPQDNMYVKTEDTLLAKNFMKTLKAVLANHELDKIQPFKLDDALPPQPKEPKDELTITKWIEYPFTKNFPQLLHTLKINKMRMQEIDRRILDLCHLHTLDMGMNRLNALPADLGRMAALTHLELNNNELADIPAEVFTGNIASTLTSLDLSYNVLRTLPPTLTRLRKLKALALTGNNLVSLPLNLGKLTSLRSLKLEDNNLAVLPASISRLRLNVLKEHRNPLKRSLGIVENRLTPAMGPPRLKELAAHICMKRKLSESDIPATLHDYLLDYQVCLCGQPCFEAYILACIPLRLQTQALLPWAYNMKRLEEALENGLESEIRLLTNVVPALATLCSHECLKRTTNRQTRASMLIVESSLDREHCKPPMNVLNAAYGCKH